MRSRNLGTGTNVVQPTFRYQVATSPQIVANTGRIYNVGHPSYNDMTWPPRYAYTCGDGAPVSPIALSWQSQPDPLIGGSGGTIYSGEAIRSIVCASIKEERFRFRLLALDLRHLSSTYGQLLDKCSGTGTYPAGYSYINSKQDPTTGVWTGTSVSISGPFSTLDPSFPFLGEPIELTKWVESATVTQDTSQPVQRTMTLLMLDSTDTDMVIVEDTGDRLVIGEAPIDYQHDYVQPIWCLRAPDNGWIQIPLGVFKWNTPGVDIGGFAASRNGQLSDLSYIIMKNLATNPAVPLAGQTASILAGDILPTVIKGSWSGSGDYYTVPDPTNINTELPVATKSLFCTNTGSIPGATDPTSGIGIPQKAAGFLYLIDAIRCMLTNDPNDPVLPGCGIPPQWISPFFPVAPGQVPPARNIIPAKLTGGYTGLMTAPPSANGAHARTATKDDGVPYQAGNWTVCYTYYNTNGESAPSPTDTINLNGKQVIIFNNVVCPLGTDGINIYISEHKNLPSPVNLRRYGQYPAALYQVGTTTPAVYTYQTVAPDPPNAVGPTVIMVPLDQTADKGAHYPAGSWGSLSNAPSVPQNLGLQNSTNTTESYSPPDAGTYLTFNWDQPSLGSVIAPGGPGVGAPVMDLLVPPGKDGGITIDGGTSYLDQINSFLHSGGFDPIYMSDNGQVSQAQDGRGGGRTGSAGGGAPANTTGDVYGIITHGVLPQVCTRPWPRDQNYLNFPVMWCYDSTRDSIVDHGVHVELDIAEMANVVSLTLDATNNEVYYVIAENKNPSSPISLYVDAATGQQNYPFRVVSNQKLSGVPLDYSHGAIAFIIQQAQYYLNRGAAVYQTVTMTTAVNGFHESGDTIALNLYQRFVAPGSSENQPILSGGIPEAASSKLLPIDATGVWLETGWTISIAPDALGGPSVPTNVGATTTMTPSPSKGGSSMQHVLIRLTDVTPGDPANWATQCGKLSWNTLT